tara:strand:- start:1240 stop:1680 length:441 start_codon:yes stop_codon:yes gene_type:complete
MKIYKLTSAQSDEVYVGKTNKTLDERFCKHFCEYKRWLKGIGKFNSSYFLTEYDDVKIELIEENNNSLKEIYWIRQLNSCNFYFNGPDYFIYKQQAKDCLHGFIYVFEIRRNNKRLVGKKSVDLDYLRKFRNEWIKNNEHLFIEDC